MAGSIRLVARTEPVRESTPRRCRSCRGGRSRWAGRPRPATFARSRLSQILPETDPCRVLAIILPPGVGSSPQANSASSLATAGGELPFRFGGQIPTGPARIGQRVLIGDVNDGMVTKALNRCCPGPAGGASRHLLVKLTSDPSGRLGYALEGRRNTGDPAWSMAAAGAPGYSFSDRAIFRQKRRDAWRSQPEL